MNDPSPRFSSLSSAPRRILCWVEVDGPENRRNSKACSAGSSSASSSCESPSPCADAASTPFVAGVSWCLGPGEGSRIGP